MDRVTQEDGQVIITEQDADGQTRQVLLWNAENADLMERIIKAQDQCTVNERLLAARKIGVSPLESLIVKFSMLLQELWSDETPEGQLRQLAFTVRYEEARLHMLQDALKQSSSILLRANANGAPPPGLIKGG
jgi:hypothetical protein